MKAGIRGGLVVLSVVLAAAAVRAADPAYVGKWRFNQSKSVVTGDTVSIGQAPGGMMQFNSQGFDYTFKLDGKEYPTPDGGTTAWKATSADVWDVTNHLKGKVASTYHMTLKADALSVAGKMMKPDGTSMDFTATYKRVGSGTGFTGKWMSTEVKMPATTLAIATSGANGVTMSSDGMVFASGQFDSRDNPAQGMMAGSKTSFAFRKLSATSFEVTGKIGGKPMYREVYSVSADGKTLTNMGTPLNAKQEPYKMVFDKQ